MSFKKHMEGVMSVEVKYSRMSSGRLIMSSRSRKAARILLLISSQPTQFAINTDGFMGPRNFNGS